MQVSRGVFVTRETNSAELKFVAGELVFASNRLPT